MRCDHLTEDFNKPKIVWAEMTNEPKFVVDEYNRFIDNTEYFINGDHLEYITCILNSKIYTWLFDQICAKGMGARKWRKQYVETLPIPKPKYTILLQFYRLYKSRTAESDAMIECLIADMLNLTQQERTFIRDLELAGF